MLKTAMNSIDITPEDDVPLMGYGDRTHNSTGIHDPLYAYAWYFEDNSGSPFVWLMLDLCVFSVASARDLSEEISRVCGIPADRLFITVTHTHSGPDTSFISRDTKSWAVDYYQLLITRLSSLVIKTMEESIEGYIEVRYSECTLGVNRRHTEDSIDPRVVVFCLFDKNGNMCSAAFHYSCHLTALGVENYQISADWAGTVRFTLEKEFGVPFMYLQGAEGNVDPVCRGTLDMADPDQARGSSFEVMTETANQMIDAVRMALTSGTIERIKDAEFTYMDISLPLRFGGLSSEEIRRKIDDWKKKFSVFLEIPVEEIPEDWIINALIKDKCRETGCSPEKTRMWVSAQFAYMSFLNVYGKGGDLIDPGGGEMKITAALIKLGNTVILGAPMELLVDIALDWQERFPGKTALIAGLFNGWTGYLPHRKNFSEVDADMLYETVSTMFAEDASIHLLTKAEQQIRRLL